MLYKGMSQRELAELLGTTTTAVSYMLRYELSDAEQDRIIDRIAEA